MSGWTHIQSNTAYNTNAVTLPSNTAGDLLIVTTDYLSPTATPSLSDTAGNTWSSFSQFGGTPNGGSSVGIMIYYCLSCKGYASTNTFTFTSETDQSCYVGEFSYTGTAAVESDTVTTTAGSTATTTPTSGTLNIIGGNDLVFAIIADETTGQTSVTAGSIFGSAGTIDESQHNQFDAQEYQLNVTGTNGTASITLGAATNTWLMYVVAFSSSSITFQPDEDLWQNSTAPSQPEPTIMIWQ